MHCRAPPHWRRREGSFGGRECAMAPGARVVSTTQLLRDIGDRCLYYSVVWDLRTVVLIVIDYDYFTKFIYFLYLHVKLKTHGDTA